ncbi:MAG: FAD-binding oxidoreductase [Steroidobacteraceae bacterium]
MRFTTHTEHRKRVEQLAAALRSSAGPVRLRKRTSNLFRPRQGTDRVLLNGTTLNHVIAIDRASHTAEVEGMTTYADLVDATLPLGLAPAVVPELKSITVGGATTGVGIESSAFRCGLVHETVDEFDVLVADGRVLRCSPTEHADLFCGFPNSYGSLGYATRLIVRLVPVAPFVHLRHERFAEAARYFAAIAAECADPTCDYLDGVFFGAGDFVLTRATLVEQLPVAAAASDYTWMQQYWRSLRACADDYLTIGDYLWRWDTDWFWCSRNVGAHFAPVRLLAGPRLLSSVTYQKIMRAGQRYPLKALVQLRARSESVIQDVDIPLAAAASFLAQLHAEVGITPVWVCPFRVTTDRYPLYRLRTDTPYVNFGFWDTVRSRQPDGHYNAIVERLVARHGGKKSLYSRSTFDEQAFWTMYDRHAYEALKREYDPTGRFPGLYEKTVGRG